MVEHDEQTEHEVRHVLPQAQRLSRKELAALPGCLRQPLLHQAQIRQPEAVQQARDPSGQRVEGLLKISADVELSRLDALVHAGPLLYQQDRDQRQRQNHHQHDDHEGGEGGERAPVSQGPPQPPVERGEDDREDDPPEHRPEQRQDDPGEGDRYRDKQNQERLVIEPG